MTNETKSAPTAYCGMAHSDPVVEVRLIEFIAASLATLGVLGWLVLEMLRLATKAGE